MTMLGRFIIWLFGALLCSSCYAQAPIDLFKPVANFGKIEPTESSGGIAVTRYRIVQTKSAAISRAEAAHAPRQGFGPDKRPDELPSIKVVNLNLFDNLSFIADLKTAVSSQDNKTITWSGIIRGAKQSSVTIAVTGRTVIGNVTTTTGELYEIRPIGGADSATQVILEIDGSSFPKDGKPLPVKGPGMAQDVNPNAPPALLNVLVAYTQASAAVVGGAAGIAGLTEVARTETNQGYLNSGVQQRIQIVGITPVLYDEKDGYDLALQRLSDPHDGYMDEVHSARAKAHADMVVLLIKNNQYCGLSYLAQPPTSAFASKAFSVVNIGCATGNFSFAHELGHLQGCNHDRADADGPGAFPYSYGYQQTSKDPHFRDIMSYDCPTGCGRINYWSNPQIQYQGIPVGETTDQSSTNNALTLNRTQYVASGWRP
jgi:hypothetical protein